MPVHWAASNKQLAAVQFFLENFKVDVLAKNQLGRSTLTEAFQSQDKDIIEACLSHSSASEEKLLQGFDKVEQEETTTESVDASGGKEMSDGDDILANSEEKKDHALTHKMKLCRDSSSTLLIRELPITRADNPFGTDVAPENDTTGLAIWPASIILARWIANYDKAALPSDSNDTANSATEASTGVNGSAQTAIETRKLDVGKLLEGKVVLELGSGCGLPAIAAGRLLLYTCYDFLLTYNYCTSYLYRN